MSLGVPWEELELGKCYKSSFEYLRKQGVKADDEIIGKMTSKPVKEMYEDTSNPDSQWGRGAYSIWSADFEKNGVVSKRYQVAGRENKPGLGFYFTEVDCSNMKGGQRRRRKTRRVRKYYSRRR